MGAQAGGWAGVGGRRLVVTAHRRAAPVYQWQRKRQRRALRARGALRAREGNGGEGNAAETDKVVSAAALAPDLQRSHRGETAPPYTGVVKMRSSRRRRQDLGVKGSDSNSCLAAAYAAEPHPGPAVYTARPADPPDAAHLGPRRPLSCLQWMAGENLAGGPRKSPTSR